VITRGFQLNLFCFLLLGAQPIFAYRCVTEILKTVRLNDVESHLGPPPAPVGMESPDFQDLLKIFRNDPNFSDADVIVIYGSRTHFRAGYSPRMDSDLDVSIFYPRSHLEAIDGYSLDRLPSVNSSLRSVSFRTGFDISEQVPRFESFEEFLEVELKAEGFEDQFRAQRFLDALAEDGNWDEDTRRALYLNNKGDHWFNPEAIFIFKDSTNLMERVMKLRKIGYHNFYLLADGTHKRDHPR